MERVAVNMANHWAERGWQPTLLTTSHGDKQRAYELHPEAQYRDIGWPRPIGDEELDPASLRAVMKTLEISDRSHAAVLANVPLMTVLRRELAAAPPDAIISLGDVTNIRVIAATEGLPIRRFVSERCDPRRNDIGPWEPLRQRLYPRADGVVTLTRDAAQFFEQSGCVCHVIPNSVPKPRVGPNPNREGRRCVTISRLEVYKRIPLLIRAFAAIADRHPEWSLDIWGEGPRRSKAQQTIDELGIGDRVRLRGHATDVYGVLAEADLFAMTSESEGFPNALCEAMASGVAPVVIDCGPGVRDIIRDGIDGILVRGADADHFAAALDRLMTDDGERRRLGARAAEIVERFAPEKVMRQWEELIA
jgi:GalNAc-alpha-(1->4)-GalNAc-alpha-(1->3)-diNAcBac-PP-undecaprenol alpha-1,4-N-acetyl-D-galactosaminyltransferase